MQVRSILKFKLILFFIFLGLNVIRVYGGTTESEKYYREAVYMHIGHDTYITGERIWFKAYCRNISNTEKPALSKVIYVELIDSKNKHVLGLILNARNGSSESCLDIPDTLATGVYYFKAYTQWMENFSSEMFYSQPVYIYNLYNNENSRGNENFRIPEISNLFVDGNKLIDGIQSKITVSFPAFIGKPISLKVIEKETGQQKTEFTLNNDGIGIFDLLPVVGNQYYITVADSSGQSINFTLPAVVAEGYKLNIADVTESSILVNIEKANRADKKLILEAFDGEKKLDSKIISASQLNNINLSTAGLKGSIINLILRNDKDEVLASASVKLNPNYSLQLQSLQKIVHPGEKIEASFLFDSKDKQEQVKGSIKIYKDKPALKDNCPGSVNINGSEYYVADLNKNYSLLLPKYFDQNINKTANNSVPVTESLLPVEDLGIVYTGTVYNKESHSPGSEINLLFSVKDSIPNIQSVSTDVNGKFAILVNLFGTPEIFLSLIKDGDPVSKQYIVDFDKKFYYDDNTVKSTSRFLPADSSFVSNVKDEAQRALIQRVFAKKEDGSNISPVETEGSPEYFSKSVLTVLTDDFFAMPNFEEIAREILPRVQYRKSREGCNFSIATSAPEGRSLKPLVLLNGVPVEYNCDLFDLNSEMISKILIQHESRIVGNLFYESMISIITVPSIKAKYLKPNSENRIDLLCFNVSPEFDPMQFNKLANLTSKLPDFRNLLYWNSVNLSTEKSFPVQFITSDEEGEYIVELNGFLSDGTPINYQTTFTVQSK
jgi:hypothetical protein